MLPTLKGGDRLKVVPVDPQKLTVGDIAVLHKDNIVCHRIVGRYKVKDRLFFLEKGDNRNKGFVKTVSAKEVMGRVIAVETEDGEVRDYRMISNNIIKLRCRIFGIIYRFGKKIEKILFSNSPKGFKEKVALTAAKALNYLI